MAGGWSADSTLDPPGQTLDKPAGPSLSATKRKHKINIMQMIVLHLHLHLSATSPCWSELAAACSRWCRGRGICWFVKRLDGLESPAPGQWTPAWRGAAQHRDRQQQQVTQTPPHLAQPPAPGRTRAGRIPEEHVEVVTFTQSTAFSKHSMHMNWTNTLVSWISISSVCWRPLPPAHLQEFWGREEGAEREGDPRIPAETDRPLWRTEMVIKIVATSD